MSETLPATTVSEDDFALIEAAVMETERGRWFLAEYARRNRHADTETILGAIERIEGKVDKKGADPAIATIRFEIADLAEAIERAKSEIAQIQTEGKSGDRFDEAVTELDAIVSHTEQATGEILEAAEKIQEIAWTLRENGAPDSFCDILDDQATQIYTACSFQDITGQRTRKVVNVVSYLERRIHKLIDVLNGGQAFPDTIAEDDPLRAASVHNDDRSDADLLNGPGLADEAQDQDTIDALFKNTGAFTQGALDALFEEAQEDWDAGEAEAEDAEAQVAAFDEAASPVDDDAFLTVEAVEIAGDADGLPDEDAPIVEDMASEADVDAAFDSFNSFDEDILALAEGLETDADADTVVEAASADEAEAVDEALLDEAFETAFAEDAAEDEEDDPLAALDVAGRRALFG